MMELVMAGKSAELWVPMMVVSKVVALVATMAEGWVALMVAWRVDCWVGLMDNYNMIFENYTTCHRKSVLNMYLLN
jgi:hypothetical protein